MKYLTAILLLTMNTAQAATLAFNFSHPEARENGDYLDISEIAGTRIWLKMDGEPLGSFRMPVEWTSFPIHPIETQTCFQYATVLLDGTESKTDDDGWFCYSNTPKKGD